MKLDNYTWWTLVAYYFATAQWLGIINIVYTVYTCCFCFVLVFFLQKVVNKNINCQSLSEKR